MRNDVRGRSLTSGEKVAMTKLAPHMYEICEEKAKARGPISIPVNGEIRTVYALSRDELKKIFAKNGFREDRIAWLKYIINFRDNFDVVAPEDKIIMNPKEKWFAVFTIVTTNEYKYLQYSAEEFKAPVLAVEP